MLKKRSAVLTTSVKRVMIVVLVSCCVLRSMVMAGPAPKCGAGLVVVSRGGSASLLVEGVRASAFQFALWRPFQLYPAMRGVVAQARTRHDTGQLGAGRATPITMRSSRRAPHLGRRTLLTATAMW